MTDDKFISEADEAERDAEHDARAANLFDVRRFIGVLFVLGLGASNADIDKAAGVNVNLWTGLAMLVVGALFLFWAFTRPLSKQLAESEAASGGAGGD